MTILKQELRQGRNALILWTSVIVFMLLICILIYPEMGSQMNELSGAFANMGGFSAAFGMDKINFGEFMGFFSVECGNILGLGGAFFAALLGISALAKEEKEHTAEFLLTHPLSRKNIVLQKGLSVLVQILILNAAAVSACAFCAFLIGEKPDIGSLTLLFLAYLTMQIETAAVCFGISAWISSGGLGIGLGGAALFYFLNLISNLAEGAKFLKFLTPFGYTDGAEILISGHLDAKYVTVGILFTAAGIAAAFWKYCRKDISV